MLVRLEQWWSSLRTGLQWGGFERMPPLFIISGHRSPAHNADVGGAAGSLHTACPSLAADLRMGNVAGLDSDEAWAILGGKWRLMGGRWGGQFRDPDPNHFDLGVAA